jgi:hypothetical protein
MKLLSLCVLTMLSLAFTSCKKEFTCTCTGGFAGHTIERTLRSKDTKNAKKDCIALSDSKTTNDGYECDLKP